MKPAATTLDEPGGGVRSRQGGDRRVDTRADAPVESGASRIAADEPPVSLQRGLALGFLAMVPLFLLYEVVMARQGSGGARNAAEIVLTLPFTKIGIDPTVARTVALAGATIAAVWTCFHTRLGLLARIGRVAAEGALCALVLGPLLILLQRALDLGAPAGLVAPHGVPPLGSGLLQVSGAAFEEIVFRVGIQSALYVLALELYLYFVDVRVVARSLAEVSAVTLGAFLFAAAHLSLVTHLLGGGGEAWDPAVFAWRFLAGVALGILFRWRGPGVAAWTHAFFNLALFVGAGPDVFL